MQNLTVEDGSQNYWNPFRDWNVESYLATYMNLEGLKTTETLLGIETIPLIRNEHSTICLKTTETLLGIETFLSLRMM